MIVEVKGINGRGENRAKDKKWGESILKVQEEGK